MTRCRPASGRPAVSKLGAIVRTNTTHSRRLVFFPSVVIAAAAATTLPAPAGQYTFTKIADNSGTVSSFYAPSLNAAGQVAYGAILKDGNQAIFANVTGGAPRPVLSTAGTYNAFPVTGIEYQHPSLNNDGTVAFSPPPPRPTSS